MSEIRWLDTVEQRVWRAYLDSGRLVNRALDRQMRRDSGMSLTDFEILVTLMESPDRRIRMGTLAEAMSTTRSGATRAIARMEGLGWVRRTECREDGRGTVAELTEAGELAQVAAAPGHVAAVRAAIFDDLAPEELAVLDRVFTGIRTRLGAQDGSAIDRAGHPIGASADTPVETESVGTDPVAAARSSVS